MSANASKGYAAITTESTAGTAETTPAFYFAHEEIDFSWENEFIDIKPIKGSRQAYEVLDGAIRPEASIRGPMYASKAYGALLYGLVGDYASAAEASSTVAFRHTFADAGTLPSFTLERSDARLGEGGLLCERLAGAKLESLSLSCAYGEKVDMDATFQATKKPVTATAVAAGSISYPVEKPFYFKGATVEADDVADNYFKTLNVEFRNMLERQESLRGTNEAFEISEGGIECSLSGTMIFSSLDWYNKLVNGTESKLELILTSDTIADAATTPDVFYQLLVTWDIVRVARYSVPYVAGEVIEADVDFRVLFNDANSRAFLIEAINLDAANAYDATP